MMSKVGAKNTADTNVAEVSEAMTTSCGIHDNADEDTTIDTEADLFTPPPSREECPICMLTLPLDETQRLYMACCGKTICFGCDFACASRSISTTKLCPFCRVINGSDEDIVARVQNRMEQNDPHAIDLMAHLFKRGAYGVTKNERKSFELFLRAAELGLARACFSVAYYFRTGIHGVPIDVGKYREYAVLAAKGGHAGARRTLGTDEAKHGRIEIAIKHWKIAATMGDHESMKYLKYECLKRGNLGKDEYADVVRAYQSAREEEWSEDRDKAAAALQKRAIDEKNHARGMHPT